jgi:predicted glycosyltransferase
MPAVIVPRTKPVSEQQIRATRLERLGLVKALSPDSLAPEQLLKAVNDAVEDHQTSASGIHQMNLAALQRVAEHVGSLLHDTQRNNGVGRSRAAFTESSSPYDELTPLAAGNN